MPHQGILRLAQLEIQGRNPKKSRNLIAVLCCFCGWIDFGVLCGLGLELRATGTLPLPVGVVLKSMRVWEDGKYGSHEVMVGAFAAHCEP